MARNHEVEKMRSEENESRVASDGPRAFSSYWILALVMWAIPAVLPAANGPDWPARPVRIVAPFAPGGSADTLGRMVAEKLTVRFKQNFVVDNRPGAGGTVGSELVANSAPDGYNLLE